jgi:hypothetical protein
MPSNTPLPLNENLRTLLIDAIRHIRAKVRWKAGKDIEHLEKRIRFGHLAVSTTIAQYESIITEVVHDNRAEIYLFQYRDSLYPTFVSTVQGTVWLVMIGLNGVIETAFPPSDPDTYLSDPAYLYVSEVEELLP